MTFTINTKGHSDVIDITDQVQQELKRSQIQHGAVLIFVKGTTAAVTIIEADPNLYDDLKEFFEQIAPINKDYKHHITWHDDNGGAHIRAVLIGPSLTVPFQNGKLELGQWQRIVLIDFDTKPRQREIVVKFLKQGDGQS
ncbi:MAG: secondary thiamine-phosphate synthase enzyme YjbQ [Candidatus Paceibacteria bacterium]